MMRTRLDHMKREGFRSSFTKPILLFLLLIFIGSFSYTYLEGWNYLDALYFSVATATTLGYGDIVPITVAGKIFTICFAFATIGFAFYFFTLVGKYFFTQRVKQELIKAGRIKHDKGTRTVKA